MPMIDTAIKDVAGRFGLGPKAGPQVQELAHLITDSPGEVSGSIDKFRSPASARSSLRGLPEPMEQHYAWILNVTI